VPAIGRDFVPWLGPGRRATTRIVESSNSAKNATCGQKQTDSHHSPFNRFCNIHPPNCLDALSYLFDLARILPDKARPFTRPSQSFLIVRPKATAPCPTGHRLLQSPSTIVLCHVSPRARLRGCFYVCFDAIGQTTRGLHATSRTTK
jgi:hypothetical protein